MTADQNSLRWVPIYGDFDFRGTVIDFHGRLLPAQETTAADLASASQAKADFGLAFSSATMADGEVSATVAFASVSSQSICELLVAYDSNRHFVSAGLGSAKDALFGIREWGGDRGKDLKGDPNWYYHRWGGPRSALRKRRQYALTMRLKGGTVNLSIDDVPVASADVSSPHGNLRQVGLFCASEDKVTVTDFAVRSEKPRAFVVMQFSGEFDDVYRDVIKDVLGNYQVSVSRADEATGPGLIIADITKEITTAQLIVADITPVNPNVYFEVGYAMALNKPTILLARKGTSLPFDVAGHRVLFYENTIGGKARLVDGLKAHVNAILSARPQQP